MTDDKKHETLHSMQRVKSTNCKVNLRLIVEDLTRDFVCGTMSHAKLLLHWSILHYQVTFEWHSGCGLDMSITLNSIGVNHWHEVFFCHSSRLIC